MRSSPVGHLAVRWMALIKMDSQLLVITQVTLT